MENHSEIMTRVENLSVRYNISTSEALEILKIQELQKLNNDIVKDFAEIINDLKIEITTTISEVAHQISKK